MLKLMIRRTLAIGIVALLVGAMFWLAISPAWAAPQAQWRAVITSPEPGTTVGGIVEIRGYATHNNLDHYQVRYAPGETVTGDTAWVDIVQFIESPVENNVLCTWDTTELPNGSYVLAVAVWGVDDPGNPHTHFVERISVDNSTLPTPEPATAQPAATVAAESTPTPMTVAQPATPTPRPSPTPLLADEAVTPTLAEEDAGFDFNMVMMREAFCTGGLIAAMLFLLWGLYVMGKASIRWYMRDSSGSPGA